ncbi:MAG: acyltransferase family protein [Actinomycetota bacterium]
MTTAKQAPAATRLRYVPALDGLRAVAVGAVLLYHSDLTGFRGGFLGVDVFFVLSGYLITSILLTGRRKSGSLGLKQFWLARARRLLPALFLMLGVTCAYTAIFLPHEAAKLRDDALAALGYVTNWHLVFGGQSYFEATGRPSMVQHLWSLAVEEQFYLLWPLLLGGGLLIFRRHLGRLAAAVMIAAGASTVLMATLYDPAADPSRVYYGTDTHAMGLLVGAALALVWPAWRLSWKAGVGARPLLDLTGVVALVGLVWCFDNVSEFDPGLYRGGYLLFALLAALVVAIAVHPAASVFGALLGARPLRWIGMRSYGIYLWHWPVYLVTRPGIDIPLTGGALTTLRVAITVTLASLSYRFVEMPVRDGAVGRAIAALRARREVHRRRARVRLALVGTGVTAGAALLVVGMAAATPAPRPPGLEADAVRIDVTTTVPGATETTVAAATETTAPPATAAPTTAAPTTLPPATRITAIGDSVMLGSQGALSATFGPLLQLDAAVSRQAEDAVKVAGLLAAAGQLGDRVVVHLGTNGVIRPEQFDELMRILAPVPRVIIVNTAVPRPWEAPVNALLATSVPSYPNAVLLDWKTVAAQHPEFFIEDGVHLKPEGASVYAALIAQQM